MLTRNFDSIMAGYLSVGARGTSVTEAEWLGGRPGAVKTQFGLIKGINQYPLNDDSVFGNAGGNDKFVQLPTSSNQNYAILLVGSNNAAETYDDFAISIISDLTVIGSRYSNITYTADGCVYNTVKTFVNNTENDITVNEVGIFYHFDNTVDALVYRKKLDKSVTLKAQGGTASFNVVIDIPYANKP